MALAADPLAPQKDLTSQELASGYGYGPGVSYVGGICNPAGRRSGTQFTVTDATSMATALSSCTYGDDIVIAAGSTVTSGGAAFTFPTLGAPTTTTARQAPARMVTHVVYNSVSSSGQILGGPTPTSPSKMTGVAKMNAPSRMASVILQGDPSYVRIMSSEAHLVTNPPPHTQWHVTNYAHFAHLVEGNGLAALLETPDSLTNYAGYHYFRMEGLRLVSHATNGKGYFISIGAANAQSINTGPHLAPHHFIFDRCYIDGDICGTGVVPAGQGNNRGVTGGCDYFGFLNGRSSGIYRNVETDSYNFEANSFSFNMGIGPFHVENSWLTGAGEIVLNNHDTSTNYPYPWIVSDSTFIRNWCIRPLSWRESFHYNSFPPRQRPGGATCSIDGGGTVVTMSFGNLFDRSNGEFVPGDYFWTSTSGRPVRISSLNSETVCTLGSAYTENAGGTGLSAVFARGRQLLDGTDAKKVTLSGAGNRTVTGTGTSWLTTLKPYVDNPPPGSGVFFGVNSNVVNGISSQKIYPILRQILSVDSDTQLTLAQDYTAGTFSNVYYSVTFWDGNVRSVMKNLHEWKASNRIRVVGNVFENSWATFNGQGENAWSLNLTSSGPGYQQDDYYGYNQVINAGLILYSVGCNFQFGPPTPELNPLRRVCMEHNLCTDVYNPVWQVDYGAVILNNFLPYVLNPGGFDGIGGASGTNDWQFRHNNVVAATDYQPYLKLLFPSIQSAASLHQRLVFRDNIAHVGDHASIKNTLTAGFCGGSSTQANADTYDADGMGGTNPNSSFQKTLSADSVLANNVFLRNSAAAIADHTVSFGAGNAGLSSETGTGFTNFGNSANIPRWLTQSVSPADYALTNLYVTSPGVCTVSGATVTISVGSFPAAVVKGTPFLVQGDSYLYMTRVSTRDSGSQLTLVAAYPGTTGSGLTATIGFKGAASDGTAGQTLYTTNASAATVTNISATSFTESFPNNGATIGTQNQTWVQTGGTNWGVSGGAATLVAASGSTDQIEICQRTLLSPDHKASFTLSNWTLASNAQVGPIVRSDSAGGSYYYFRAVPASGHNFELGRVIGGGTAALATNSTVPAAGQVLELEATGTSLICRINGTPVITMTDTSITTGNFVGFRGFRGTAGDAVALDSFSAQTTTALNIAQVTLSSGSFPLSVTPSGNGLFPRTFLVSGDAAGNATSVTSRDSATQITLGAQYPGTIGAGLTGVITGTVPSGVDPGPDTATLALMTGSIRT